MAEDLQILIWQKYSKRPVLLLCAVDNKSNQFENWLPRNPTALAMICDDEGILI